MNIFVLDTNPAVAATLLCDQHIGKMLLEACQLLCGAHREPWELHSSNSIAASRRRYEAKTPAERLTDDELPYLPTHLKHPCSVWVRNSLSNYQWLVQHALSLASEYHYRFGKHHDSASVAVWLARRNPIDVPTGHRTPFAQAMPEQYRSPDAVAAYRRYYAAEKQVLRGKPVTWTRRLKPDWFETREIER